jgi:hypothetical protein
MRLAVTTYSQNYSWRRPADTTVDFILSQTDMTKGFRCSAPTATEAMRETISFPGCNQVDGSGFVRTTSDNQTRAAIFRGAMSF